MQNESLVLDMIEWIDTRSRTYNEVMEAWRTSCPRLSIWEDAVDAGFVSRRRLATDPELMVVVTDAGRSWLSLKRRSAA